MREEPKQEFKTYYVPTILAMPKSDILGFMFSSNKILLGLRSRCITLSREYSCK